MVKEFGAVDEKQRAEMLAKAAETRELKRLNSGNIVALSDATYHRDLASKHGVRMPPSYCQADELKYVRRVAKKMDVDLDVWVKEVVGARTLAEVSRLNSDYGACGMVGLLLEWADEVLSKEVEFDVKRINGLHHGAG